MTTSEGLRTASRETHQQTGEHICFLFICYGLITIDWTLHGFCVTGELARCIHGGYGFIHTLQYKVYSCSVLPSTFQ